MHGLPGQFASSRGHSCMRMAVDNQTNVFIYRFQGIFNANIVSELAVHSESKMKIFTSGPLQGFRAFSLVNRVNRQVEAEMIDVHQTLGLILSR